MKTSLSQLKIVGTCAVLLLCAALLLLGACTHQRYAPAHSRLLSVPDVYWQRLSAARDAAPDEEKTHATALPASCSGLYLPGLASLLSDVRDDNFRAREAIARIRAANAVAEQAGAAQWPTLQAGLEASRGKSAPSLQLPAGTGSPEFIETRYRASLMASYEVDIWRRLANRADALRLQAEATVLDRDALLISLAATTAETWANLLAQRHIEDVLTTQLALSRDYVALMETRYRLGAASALDVIQQRQQLQSLEGEQAITRANRKTLAVRVAALTGQLREQAFRPRSRQLPTPPPLPPARFTLAWLEQRPDVMASYLRLLSADERSAAAVASRLPGLTVSVNGYSSAKQFERLFDTLFWDLSADLFATVLDAGRLRAAVEEAESNAEAQLYRYAQTLLTALQEVETAWIRNQHQNQLIDSLEQQITSAERALVLTRSRYLRGAVSYLRLLTALQSLQSLQRRMVQAHGQQFANRIELCRALGMPPGASVRPTRSSGSA